jgi:hypothetical protein
VFSCCCDPVRIEGNVSIKRRQFSHREHYGDVDASESLRLAVNRIRELAAAIGPDLASADWHRTREIIRTLVQRIDIEPEIIKVIFRVTQNARGSGNPIAVTLPRPLIGLENLGENYRRQD